MKNKFITNLKPLTILPALIVLYLIFSFSGQDGDVSSSLSYNVSVKIVTIGDQLMNKELTDELIVYKAECIEGPIRKLAHMGEYFILAISIYLPLYVYGRRGIQLILLAGILCVISASLDEFHQYFISGRTAAPSDVLIDSVGISLGIAVFHIRNKIAQPRFKS